MDFTGDHLPLVAASLFRRMVTFTDKLACPFLQRGDGLPPGPEDERPGHGQEDEAAQQDRAGQDSVPVEG